MQGRVYAALLLCSLFVLTAVSGKGQLAAEPEHIQRLPLVVKPDGFSFFAYPDSETRFNRPVDIQHAGDDRLFVVTQGGIIYIVHPSGNVTEFLDVADRVVRDNWEQGLLGLAFHPDHAQNGLFFIYYTGATDDPMLPYEMVLARYQVSADPDVADPTSEVRLLAMPKSGLIHNGGGLVFHPHDGLLYVSIGDGGRNPNAPDPTNLEGKLLRLDVNGASGADPDCGLPGAPYTIPSDNPYAGQTGANCAEIWAKGLRNPWRFDIDPVSGALFVADVGNSEWEEINHVSTDSGGGFDFGWPCYEGPDLFLEQFCQDGATYTAPVHAYYHTNGRCSIIGGPVTWDLYGGGQAAFIFGDLCSSEVFALIGAGAEQTVHALGRMPAFYGLTSFGSDATGRLFTGEYGDEAQIYRLTLP